MRLPAWSEAVRATRKNEEGDMVGSYKGKWICGVWSVDVAMLIFERESVSQQTANSGRHGCGRWCFYLGSVGDRRLMIDDDG